MTFKLLHKNFQSELMYELEDKIHWIVRFYDRLIEKSYQGIFDLICTQTEAQANSITVNLKLNKWDDRDDSWVRIGEDYNVTVHSFQDLKEVLLAVQHLETTASHCSFIHEHEQ